MWKLYNIEYESDKGPDSLLVDLDGYSWSSSIPVGPHNLNHKAFRAIKELTGCDAITCKFDTIWLD
jgi:hypothetical protein